MLAVCSACEIGAEGAASLAPELQHLELLQSLNLWSKQQGSGVCVCRGLHLGRRGWYLRGGPVAALCIVGVLGAGAWCVCAGFGDSDACCAVDWLVV